MSEEDKNLVTLEGYDASFRFPERVSVKTALKYWSIVTAAMNTEYRLLRQWEACVQCGFLQDWDCERFPDPKIPLEKVPEDDEMYVSQVIMVVAARCQNFMMNTRSVEKN